MRKKRRNLKKLVLSTCTFLLLGSSVYAAPEVGLSRDRFNEQPLLNFYVDNGLSQDEGNIKFHSYSNYRGAIRGAIVQVYDGEDITLVSPIQTIDIGRINNFSSFLWDGILADGTQVKQGKSYRFVLEVQDDKGNRDRTIPFEVTFKSEELLGEREEGLPAFGTDKAAQRSITPKGDIWVLRGTGIESGDSVVVNEELVFFDSEGKFLITEFYDDSPVFDVKITNQEGALIYEN